MPSYLILQIGADSTAHRLLIAIDSYVSGAVGFVSVEVCHQPLAAYTFHEQSMFLGICFGVERAVFPCLPHADGSHGVRSVSQADCCHLAVGYCIAIARHEIVKPLVIHRFVFGQMVQGIQHGIQVIRQILA